MVDFVLCDAGEASPGRGGSADQARDGRGARGASCALGEQDPQISGAQNVRDTAPTPGRNPKITNSRLRASQKHNTLDRQLLR